MGKGWLFPFCVTNLRATTAYSYTCVFLLFVCLVFELSTNQIPPLLASNCLSVLFPQHERNLLACPVSQSIRVEVSRVKVLAETWKNE